jgi:hypothetical protein
LLGQGGKQLREAAIALARRHKSLPIGDGQLDRGQRA